MQIMKLVLSHLLLFLDLGLGFNSTDAQYPIETDTNITDTLNHTMEETTESMSATPELQSEPHTNFPQTTMVYQLGTTLKEQTTANTTPLKTEIVETTPENAFETTTTTMAQMPQTEQSTMPSTIVLDNMKTTLPEEIDSDAPSTNLHEMTVGFTSPAEDITTMAVPHTTEDITTAAVAYTTEQITTEAFAYTTDDITTAAVAYTTEQITTGAVAHREKKIIPVAVAPTPEEFTTEAVAMTTDSTEAFMPDAMDTTLFSEYGYETTTMFDEESVSKNAGVFVDLSVHPSDINWLLIIVVCVIVICALCVGMIAFVQWRKKKASGSFGPVYMNGQSKQSKKKKGAGEDAWAGPVNMEAGLECDTEAQEGLLHNDGKLDGDELVLSTFAALDEILDMSDGGVGGEGTKEVQKWEEQEPMPYIDEDVDEMKAGKTLAVNEKMNGVEKSEEKELNGGEAFCITTAV